MNFYILESYYSVLSLQDLSKVLLTQREAWSVTSVYVQHTLEGHLKYY